jgi:alkanesulfonate monooxygenase SsuD/methylene tetrahydromethanopterin reductase-like flavin-dependent oxidoreductase (luciferase family)
VFLLAAQFPGHDHSTVLGTMVAAAVAAEEAGFDEVWVAEHHFMSYGVCPSAITAAGYLLGATSRIVIGTAVSVLSTVHPVALAEQAALLDQLSGGRFHLGVGRGGPWIDLQVFGNDLNGYRHGTEESLNLLLAALTGPHVTAEGPRFRFPAVGLVPRPWTRPHPPVTLAATTPETVRLAAQRGLPLLLGMHADNTEKAAFIKEYDRVRGHDRIAGSPCQGHISTALAYVADTQREARSTIRTSLPQWLGPGLNGYRRIDGSPTYPRDPRDYTELLCRIHPVGTAEHCIDMLAATTTATGINHHILMVEGAGDWDRTKDNIQRLGAQVLPRLRRAR